MSPASIVSNNDLKYRIQLSNNYFNLENNHESAFMNASPYVYRPVASQNTGVEPVVQSNVTAKDSKEIKQEDEIDDQSEYVKRE